jgi:hypothetical protein
VINGARPFFIMRLVVSVLFLLVTAVPFAAADEASSNCQGHQGDLTPIHNGVDEGGEYIAINQQFDDCSATWYDPGEKMYVGPIPCILHCSG